MTNERNLQWFATPNTVTVFANNQRYTLTADDQRFEKVVADLRAGDLPATDVPDRMSTVDEDVLLIPGIHLRDGYLTFTAVDGNTYEIGSTLYRRLRDGGPNQQALANFLHRCQVNPRPEAVLELYDFLEATNLPITPDGHFLAYKKITSQYRDIYTQTMDNTPGQTVELPREDVDDNRNRTCSTGLHFAGYDYMDNYGTDPGNVIVVVKIDPADVVAIPADYNNQKGRTCRYTVMAAMEHRIEGAWTDDDDDEGLWGYSPADQDAFEDDDEDEDAEWLTFDDSIGGHTL